jgi:sarcosine oxidase subunit alpha
MNMQTELAIVGGGPAGLAAGIEAARRGVQVTLVDLGDQPGGALSLQMHRYDGMAGMAIGALLWQTAEAAGVTMLPRTLAWGLFEDRTLGLAIDHGTGHERSAILQAERVLIAAGAVDRPPVFPGVTLPGVTTATALTIALHRWRVRPGRNALIVGDDAITGLIAQYARDAGMGVSRTPAADGLRALAGPDGTLARVERRGPDGTPQEVFDADVMVLATGMQPANELARMVDCAMVWSDALGGHVPQRDANMQTSVPGVSVVGDAAGAGDAGSAILQGRVAAAAIADALEKKKRSFGPFPVTLTAGAFRAVDPAVWRAARMTEGVR